MEVKKKDFKCELCIKNYSSYKTLWTHNNKFHNNKNKKILGKKKLIKNNEDIKYKCNKCNKSYKHQQSKWRHHKTCDKVILKKDDNLNILKNKLENKLNYPINNQLINIIVDKSKTIEELKNKIEDKNNILIENFNEHLILNNIIISSRKEDNYINGKQLCEAGNKNLNDWLSLDSTKELIEEIKINKIDIPFINNELDYWIHPDLAIQLANFISNKFYLQVSKWIRNLFSKINKTSDINLLEEHEKEIKLKDHKIQLLEDTYNKKQKRKDYPGNNIIYMLTTEDNKKKRIYIIGKAIKLKNRLSTYNKTAEHEVVYYKSCNNEIEMNIIEQMILNKLEKYKEKANRDRFVLPVENDITFFIKVINNCINFLNSDINKV